MRILLADDQKDVRSGLRILLEQDEDMEIVGEAEETAQLLVQVHKIHPDMVLVDWELSCSRMAELLPVIRSICPPMKIIALSVRPEARKVAMDAGVDAFVSKGDQPEILLDAINRFKASKSLEINNMDYNFATPCMNPMKGPQKKSK